MEHLFPHRASFLPGTQRPLPAARPLSPRQPLLFSPSREEAGCGLGRTCGSGLCRMGGGRVRLRSSKSPLPVSAASSPLLQSCSFSDVFPLPLEKAHPLFVVGSGLHPRAPPEKKNLGERLAGRWAARGLCGGMGCRTRAPSSPKVVNSLQLG